jgi:glycoside/pentoside/hexuronide:cation symporter, GPH family
MSLSLDRDASVSPPGEMRLSLGEKVGYGLGDTASNFVWALMMNFIMYFYTDIFGITAAATGTMLLVARATDGLFDFFVGAVADRTNTRWGKFRPYLLWLCVPLGVVFVAAFTTPAAAEPVKLAYAWLTYNLLMLTYSAINIPYGALSGVMTDDPLERTSLNAWRMGLAQVGGIVANTSFLWLVARLGGDDPALGARRTVALFAAAAVALFLVTFLTTRERIQPPATQKVSLRQDLGMLLANPHWLMMFVVGIVNITFAVVRGSAGIYYLRSYLGWAEGDGRIAAFFLVGGLAMIAGAMLTRPLVRSLGKKWSFIGSMLVVAATAVPFFFIQPEQTGLVFAFQVLGMLAAGVNATLYWTLLADTADFAEWKFAARSTGLVFSATTCAQKAGMGIGAAVAGTILDRFGYVPNAEQSAEALRGILLMMSLIPAVGLAALAIAFTGYGLTEPLCRQIREELTARRAAANPTTSL